MATRLFKIDSRPIVDWGDYGDILQNGMSCHGPRQNGIVVLQRTGPFIPPITLPGIGDVIVTSEARKLLESSGLTGFDFRPVQKALIVELHWEKWDLNAEEPQQFPCSGEPEDYVLGQQHSAAASEVLGELWEVSVPETAVILRPTGVAESYRDLKVDIDTWNGCDLIRSGGYLCILFTEKAKNWFTENWGRYVTFDEFPTTAS